MGNVKEYIGMKPKKDCIGYLRKLYFEKVTLVARNSRIN